MIQEKTIEKALRPLDDEEIVLNLFTANGIIDKIRKSELIFKKYLYLDYLDEEVYLNAELIKLEMVFR